MVLIGHRKATISFSMQGSVANCGLLETRNWNLYGDKDEIENIFWGVFNEVLFWGGHLDACSDETQQYLRSTKAIDSEARHTNDLFYSSLKGWTATRGTITANDRLREQKDFGFSYLAERTAGWARGPVIAGNPNHSGTTRTVVYTMVLHSGVEAGLHTPPRSPDIIPRYFENKKLSKSMDKLRTAFNVPEIK